MSIYIKSSNGDILVFDAVMSLREDYTSRVTEHPIESGGNVTDHIISDNLKITISGVFSDYSPSNNENFSFGETEGGNEFNNNSITNKVDIKPFTVKSAGNDSNIIGYDYSLNSESDRQGYNDLIKTKLIDMQRQGDILTVFEIEGSSVKKNSFHKNVIITSMGFSEDENSGDALYVNISAEVVTFTDTKEVVLSEEFLKEAATEQAQGTTNSAEDDGKVNIDKAVIEEIYESIKKLFERDNGGSGSGNTSSQNTSRRGSGAR